MDDLLERKLFSNIQNAKEFILSQRDKSHQNSKAGLLANTDGKVTEGRNKRLFIANDSNDVIKQHLGERLLTEQQVKTWKRLFRPQELAFPKLKNYLGVGTSKTAEALANGKKVIAVHQT